jgi:hypothetical protein
MDRTKIKEGQVHYTTSADFRVAMCNNIMHVKTDFVVFA